ncbi:MAG: A/G-specific adenine glycosylase [Xanthomonadales bacterium]|nr:A/G-specific adenine glycosylase [Xanthomonadales bacterium]
MTRLARRLLAWHQQHGRHDLPWQHPRSAYRVWISEIMLQQTQVTTVIPYFERFMQALPTLADLAEAPEDRVLALWEGLGYYSRARNLHKAARLCVSEHDGDLPADFDSLVALPGIGRSTAGAILAQSHGLPYPILDGNAKRVLARFHAIEGWPGRSAVQKQLWAVAERHTPDEQVTDYTQAIMDLGATVCTARNPGCIDCPLSGTCEAHRLGDPTRFPGRKPRKEIPERSAYLVIQASDGQLLLEKRPPAGIWGGLWSLPVSEECPGGVDAEAPLIRHAFTHFRLNLTPVLLESSRASNAVMDNGGLRWCDAQAASELGLPGPVRKFVDAYFAGNIQWQKPFIA